MSNVSYRLPPSPSVFEHLAPRGWHFWGRLWALPLEHVGPGVFRRSHSRLQLPDPVLQPGCKYEVVSSLDLRARVGLPSLNLFFVGWYLMTPTRQASTLSCSHMLNNHFPRGWQWMWKLAAELRVNGEHFIQR